MVWGPVPQTAYAVWQKQLSTHVQSSPWPRTVPVLRVAAAVANDSTERPSTSSVSFRIGVTPRVRGGPRLRVAARSVNADPTHIQQTSVAVARTGGDGALHAASGGSLVQDAWRLRQTGQRRRRRALRELARPVSRRDTHPRSWVERCLGRSISPCQDDTWPGSCSRRNPTEGRLSGLRLIRSRTLRSLRNGRRTRRIRHTKEPQ